MYTTTVAPSPSQLNAHLESVVDRIQQIRELSLSTEGELELALTETQDMLGALALYRSMLKKVADYGGRPQRRAA